MTSMCPLSDRRSGVVEVEEPRSDKAVPETDDVRRSCKEVPDVEADSWLRTLSALIHCDLLVPRFFERDDEGEIVRPST